MKTSNLIITALFGLLLTLTAGASNHDYVLKYKTCIEYDGIVDGWVGFDSGQVGPFNDILTVDSYHYCGLGGIPTQFGEEDTEFHFTIDSDFELYNTIYYNQYQRGPLRGSSFAFPGSVDSGPYIGLDATRCDNQRKQNDSRRERRRDGRNGRGQ